MNDSPGGALSASLTALIARAREADGQPPFSDQSLVDLRTGVRELVSPNDGDDDGRTELGAALVSPTEAEFVIDPGARGRGLGTALLEKILARSRGELLVWAHGDHPAARALAASHGLEAVRELLHLTVALDPADTHTGTNAGTAASPTGSFTLATFRPGIDEDAWLQLNARAFVDHPEQGSVSHADLDELASEPWFLADDFLLLWAGNELAGYCWLKIEDGIGEFYVVGVDPDRQGQGLGRILTEAGLRRLRKRDVRTAHLYVEGDNTAAVHLYRSLGFVDDSIDIQYRAAAR